MANMFGALNRFISRLDADPNATGSNPSATPPSNSTNTHYGFQVLRNTNPSLPLDPWFDFVIGINGHNITNSSPHLFATEVQNCAGSTISLGVYGAKGQAIREVYVSVPPKEQGAILGLSLQWTPLSAAEEVWHILDVIPNSPGDVAGLLPYSDYVIGSPEGPMYGDAGLGQLIEAFIDRPLRLFVYNQEYDVTRLVTLTPARNWGGEGALGCVLGYGALHRIPAPLGEPANGPGETLFESGGDDPSQATASTGADFLVPANMQMMNAVPTPLGGNEAAPPPPPPKTGGKARKARAHPAPASGGGLDDYFAEGEQKSREMEGGGSTPKPSVAGLPPPPKSGPPKAASPAPPAAAEEGKENEDGEVD
ncbi:golgi reassembly stacking protein [Zymoseptoria brevis]|uniref:Golgi reassembly stacking protein n=1 Tax=Zymoseptoria brevis TaxID=1047168 RepID=A0A0F4GQQ8_9PEZI|nr:golgi reassembly stacking protein [Zymoseptoria brevis]